MNDERSPYNILHTLRSVRIDGVVKVVLRYISTFHEPRFRHFVCAMRSEDQLVAEFRAQGVEPVFIGYDGPAGIPAAVRRLLRVMDERDIHLVHTNRTLDLLLAGAAARIRGIPVVSSFHWLGRTRDHPQDRAPWLKRKGQELAISVLNRVFADRVIAVSAAVRDGLADVPAFPISRTEIVYPGIPMDGVADPDHATMARLTAMLDLVSATPVLLNVGRLEEVKGQIHLLEMMRIVRERWPAAVLLIAGEGALRDDLERRIHELGLDRTVRLLGARADVDALLAISDLLVLSSESEAAPLPPVEAMRAGRPVVATAVGGVPELVQDGVTGFVVPRGDAGALARAVLATVEDPETARRMGEAGRRIARDRFDISRSVRDIERIYDSLLEPMIGGEPAGTGTSGSDAERTRPDHRDRGVR